MNLKQNDGIERLHDSLLLNAMAYVRRCSVKQCFWEDAINTTNFIRNRMPHKDINNNIIYGLLFNKKFDYNRFKVFGCQVFFLFPKKFRRKLSNSTLPWIFLGFDSNPSASKVYDITNNKKLLFFV